MQAYEYGVEVGKRSDGRSGGRRGKRLLMKQTNMRRMLIALTPIFLSGVYFFGWRVLAALPVVAERCLVSYGTCSIEVNEGSRQFEIQGGANLLTALRDQEIFIPSACGGDVRAVQSYDPPRRRARRAGGGAPADRAGDPRGVRISCQCMVRNDMQIAIPEQLLSVRQCTGVVRQTRDLTLDVKELRIELVQPERIKLVPGPYIQLEVPPYGEQPRVRLAGVQRLLPRSDDTHVEPAVRLVPGGMCTTWVFTILKEGDHVAFTGPFGDFRLTDTEVAQFLRLAAAWTCVGRGAGIRLWTCPIPHSNRPGLRR